MSASHPHRPGPTQRVLCGLRPAAVMALVALSGTTYAAQPAYDHTTVQLNCSTSAQAPLRLSAMNNAHQVVGALSVVNGYVWTTSYPYNLPKLVPRYVQRAGLWSDPGKCISFLPNPSLSGADYTAAKGLSSHGVIVGVWGHGTTTQAIMWADGKYTVLDKRASTARAVDDQRWAVGVAGIDAKGLGHATLWRSGVATDLHPSDQLATSSEAVAINNLSQIAVNSYKGGQYGTPNRCYIWSSGGLLPMQMPTGGTCNITGLGSDGTAVGTVSEPGVAGRHGVKWISGQMYALPDITIVGGIAFDVVLTQSHPLGINASGVIVGYVSDERDVYKKGVLWAGAGAFDLGELEYGVVQRDVGVSAGDAISDDGWILSIERSQVLKPKP